MHYCKIKTEDIANGPGVRVSLYVSGCPHKCKGCFNPETWSYNAGKPFTEKEIQKIMASLEPGYISGLSLLGGEPLAEQNREEVALLVQKVKELFPNKTIWCWTGFLYEDLLAEKAKDKNLSYLLDTLNVLVDGPFIESQKDLSLRYCGSKNQKVYLLN
jgi:anaerobic ribonucleoside-triphosphate reductase activating protein